MFQNGEPTASGDGNVAAAAPPAQSTWQTIKGFLVRMLIMYMVMSFFRQKTPAANTDAGEGDGATSAPTPRGLPSQNLFSETTKFVSFAVLSMCGDSK